MSKTEKRNKADEIIHKMGLHKNAETTIGGLAARGISGGQKRRLSICLEILTDPQLIFMDEPTSGLDSAASLHVMTSIRSLAKDLGRTVVVSVHQPSEDVFELFDEVCLLAYGKTVYFGPRSQLKQHYDNNGFICPRNTNPADYYLRVINKDFQTEHANGNGGSRAWPLAILDAIGGWLCSRNSGAVAESNNDQPPIAETSNQAKLTSV